MTEPAEEDDCRNHGHNAHMDGDEVVWERHPPPNPGEWARAEESLRRATSRPHVGPLQGPAPRPWGVNDYLRLLARYMAHVRSSASTDHLTEEWRKGAEFTDPEWLALCAVAIPGSVLDDDQGDISVGAEHLGW